MGKSYVFEAADACIGYCAAWVLVSSNYSEVRCLGISSDQRIDCLLMAGTDLFAGLRRNLGNQLK